jgi:outer membrane protein TolC
MRHFHFRVSRRALAAFVSLLFLPAHALAQRAGGPGSGTAPAPAPGRTTNSGSVVIGQGAAAAGGGAPTPIVQPQGPLTGSARNRRGQAFSGTLTLADAIQRGLDFNLSALNLAEAVKQSRGQQAIARSQLMPNISADVTDSVQKINLAAYGFQFSSPIAGLTIPTVVGPYNNIDFRARISQSVVDMTALNNYRASMETLRAQELTAEDTRDLIVLAVGGTYIQAVASRARVASGQAQLDTATALYRQNTERRAVGLIAQLDVDRSQVQMLTQQQRLTALQNEFAKQKITLARMIGLPPTNEYELASDVDYSAAPPASLEDVLRQARDQRADFKAAEAHVRAAENALAAARAERLPTVNLSADFGTIGTGLTDTHPTFAVVGSVRIPIWQGGRTEGQILQAEAALAQRRAEFEDLEGQIEGDLRRTYLDLQAAASQVDVAARNRVVARETLDLTRQRFDAGVSDNVEVIQAQESLAGAELDYINGVFAHNIAKLTLARTMGQASTRVTDLLKIR